MLVKTGRDEAPELVQQIGHGEEYCRRQAELLAGHLPQLAALYASPLVRAADTASAIGAAQGLEVTHDDRLAARCQRVVEIAGGRIVS